MLENLAYLWSVRSWLSHTPRRLWTERHHFAVTRDSHFRFDAPPRTSQKTCSVRLLLRIFYLRGKRLLVLKTPSSISYLGIWKSSPNSISLRAVSSRNSRIVIGNNRSAESCIRSRICEGGKVVLCLICCHKICAFELFTSFQ